MAHHANVLMLQLHSFVLLAMPSIEALRSTTSKIAMLLVQVQTATALQVALQALHEQDCVVIYFAREMPRCYFLITLISMLSKCTYTSHSMCAEALQ